MDSQLIARMAKGAESMDNSMILPVVIGVFSVVVIVCVIYAIIKF